MKEKVIVSIIRLIFFQQGHRYTEKPAWKLSQSFALDIVGGKPVTTQQVPTNLVLKPLLSFDYSSSIYFMVSIRLFDYMTNITNKWMVVSNHFSAMH